MQLVYLQEELQLRKARLGHSYILSEHLVKLYETHQDTSSQIKILFCCPNTQDTKRTLALHTALIALAKILSTCGDVAKQPAQRAPAQKFEVRETSPRSPRKGQAYTVEVFRGI